MENKREKKTGEVLDGKNVNKGKGRGKEEGKSVMRRRKDGTESGKIGSEKATYNFWQFREGRRN